MNLFNSIIWAFINAVYVLFFVLQLVPGYRGYTIDSLRKLDFLDEISISADEKHHYKGLAKRKG